MIAGRVAGGKLQIGAVVARCHHEQHVRRRDGAVQRGVVSGRAQAQVADLGSVGLRVLNGPDDGRRGAAAVPPAQGLDRHDFDVVAPDDAGDPDAVVRMGGDGARAVGAVAVLAARMDLIAAGVEIPAVDIVDIAVSVVIHPVAGDLVFVHPDAALQISVGVVDTGVHQGHHHIPASAVVQGPGLLHADVHAGRGLHGPAAPGRCAGLHPPGGDPLPRGGGERKGIVEDRIGVLLLLQLEAAVVIQGPLLRQQRVRGGESGACVCVVGLDQRHTLLPGQPRQALLQGGGILVDDHLGPAIRIQDQDLAAGVCGGIQNGRPRRDGAGVRSGCAQGHALRQQKQGEQQAHRPFYMVRDPHGVPPIPGLFSDDGTMVHPKAKMSLKCGETGPSGSLSPVSSIADLLPAVQSGSGFPAL